MSGVADRILAFSGQHGGSATWKQTALGHLALHRVTGWDAKSQNNGVSGALRFDLAVDRNSDERPYVQLGLTRSQARKLIMSLMQLVEDMDKASG